MKRPRVRISTLMLLVVIAALAVALVAERTRSNRLVSQAEQARMAAIVAERNARDLLASSLLPQSSPIEVYGLDPVVFSQVASKIATDDLGGVPIEEVVVDLKAIVEGMPPPIDISDVSVRYVVNRREKQQSRAEAVKSVRSDLRLKSAVDAIGNAGAK